LEEKECPGANVLDFTDEIITGNEAALSVLRKDGVNSNIGAFYKNISFLNLQRTKFERAIIEVSDGEERCMTGYKTFASSISNGSFENLTKISLESANFANSDFAETKRVSTGTSTFSNASFPKLKSIDMSNSI
jgi:uncharacterized protein YjbI with pentapeptide repeats